MLHVHILDDERAETAYLAGLVRQWAAARGIAVRAVEYDSAESYLFAYEDDKRADILLLDIQMKGMDGVALARHIRGENEAAQIVFVTGYPNFIAEGYDVSALHYLMKPVKEDKLSQVLDRAAQRLQSAGEALLVQTADCAVKIPLCDILYIEAFAHYVAIQTKNAAIESRAGIGDMEERVGKAFVRCHRSYIVGLEHISRITQTDVILDDGRRVPLSRRLHTAVNRAFIEYHMGRR